MMVTGRVSMTNKGLMSASSKARMMATKSAVKMLRNFMPGTMYCSTNALTVVIKILIKN